MIGKNISKVGGISVGIVLAESVATRGAQSFRSEARKGGRASCSASARLLPLEPALEAALLMQKGIRMHDSAPQGPLEREASKLLAQMRERNRACCSQTGGRQSARG